MKKKIFFSLRWKRRISNINISIGGIYSCNIECQWWKKFFQWLFINHQRISSSISSCNVCIYLYIRWKWCSISICSGRRSLSLHSFHRNRRKKKDEDLDLNDKVAFAVRYLNDQRLLEKFDKFAETSREKGDLQGILLTGSILILSDQ